MALTGKQKAAMLLMGLDAAVAAELVKGLDQKMVQELAVELAYLDASGFKSGGQSTKIVQQFHDSLQADQAFHINGFLNEMLRSTVGDESAGQIRTQIQDLLCNRDPFVFISSINAQTIASVLENKHPQTTAVVLSGLPTKKSSEVLDFLDGGVRISAIGRMSSCKAMTAETRTEIAETVCRCLEAIAVGGTDKDLPSWTEQSLRKVAVILRNLGREIRDGLLGAIQRKDSRVGDIVADLMIVWEDIPYIADSSLQEALRRIDIRKLALALVKADDRLIRKIRSNISKLVTTMLDEELLLMSASKEKDVEEAREEIVHILREMNEKGELAFIEEVCDV
jgi:flagellar motor switch protein FliG